MPRQKNSVSSRRSASSRGSDAKRLKDIGEHTAQIVKEAAAILNEEVAAGVVAARRMQQRFKKERRVDPADFKEALQKFQSDAHDIVDLLNRQLDEFRSQENSALIKRLIGTSHDMLDLAVEFVETGAEVAGQLAQSANKRVVDRHGKRAR